MPEEFFAAVSCASTASGYSTYSVSIYLIAVAALIFSTGTGAVEFHYFDSSDSAYGLGMARRCQEVVIVRSGAGMSPESP